MNIPDIKTSLDITQVAAHLGIAINAKTKRANCPFHADKTPSLQFSAEKQIATCFSSNCKAGTMDVIGLTEKKLKLSTHEALKYLSDLADPSFKTPTTPKALPVNYHHDFVQMQSTFISSSVARKYAEHRALDRSKLQIGYNAFKQSKFNYLRGCIVFALKNNNNEVVSLYGRSVKDDTTAKHYYTPNRQGLYPKYPNPTATTLLLTESVIDAATLLSISEITKDHEILALYGTNGLTAEHTEAVSQLKDLQEMVLFFDGDEAGRAANEKHGNTLKRLLPQVKISIVSTPDNQDINNLAQGHESNIFTHLLKNRTPFLSNEISIEEKKTIQSPKPPITTSTTTSAHQHIPTLYGQLNTTNPHKITYITPTASYAIKGGLPKSFDSMKVTLEIAPHEGNYKRKSRTKLDLYEDKQTERVAREASEKLNLRADLLETDLYALTDLLDDYRETLSAQANDDESYNRVILTPKEKEQCIAFLKQDNLIAKINERIGQSGVVGEENNRIFLFGIASSYKMEETLHALIQGTSGSGKTHLLATIMNFMPPEDTISLTRVTESSFYNYGQYELQNKLIGMEDYDGLEEKAELAFRELQSKGMISSSTSGKNEQTGEITGFVKTVYGPIASLSATTKGEIYEDNMSRCFLVAVDESHEQTLRIIKYQNQRAAGEINKGKEKEIRAFLCNCMRLLKPYDVINPFANKIELPKEAHKIRRLNDLFQSYVKQVTLLNQYKRQKDRQNRLITDKADVRTAIDIMFDSIILKVDELDGSLRSFYERLKTYVLQKGKGYEFTQREIRHALHLSKSQMHRHILTLMELEYIVKANVSIRNTFHYKIAYWDNMSQIRHRIQEDLNKQLESL